MSGYYYCSECGDGPHNTIYNPTCPNCFQPQNNSHKVINFGYYAPATHGATSYATTDISTMGATYPSDVSSATTCHASYNQSQKQPSNWHWVCCKCGHGGGSVARDKGCSYCSDHWKCSNCTVYNASNK
ncbi:hypothetical protein GMOD_00006402 [Pyrenophora seminiperda CCB06]|uniref:Uncharacterized protein n=1 Tax=Pyrenophora seminiperda CCB06 TaxID=1302712 RepID=A0A3M7M519_9PLEO|nr:hypothetical protein GMOD_00006402 [Pyrenophora seminiperda CCB06]